MECVWVSCMHRRGIPCGFEIITFLPHDNSAEFRLNQQQTCDTTCSALHLVNRLLMCLTLVSFFLAWHQLVPSYNHSGCPQASTPNAVADEANCGSLINNWEWELGSRAEELWRSAWEGQLLCLSLFFQWPFWNDISPKGMHKRREDINSWWAEKVVTLLL